MPDKKQVNIKMAVPTQEQKDNDYERADEFEFVIEGSPGDVLYGKMPLALGEGQKLKNNPRILDIGHESFGTKIPVYRPPPKSGSVASSRFLLAIVDNQ